MVRGSGMRSMLDGAGRWSSTRGRSHVDEVAVDRGVAVDDEAEAVGACVGREHDAHLWSLRGVPARSPAAGVEPQHVVDHRWPQCDQVRASVAGREQVAEVPRRDLGEQLLHRHLDAHPATVRHGVGLDEWLEAEPGLGLEVGLDDRPVLRVGDVDGVGGAARLAPRRAGRGRPTPAPSPRARRRGRSRRRPPAAATSRPHRSAWWSASSPWPSTTCARETSHDPLAALAGSRPAARAQW